METTEEFSVRQSQPDGPPTAILRDEFVSREPRATAASCLDRRRERNEHHETWRTPCLESCLPTRTGSKEILVEPRRHCPRGGLASGTND